MFALMNKKWIKRGFLLGGFLLIIFVILKPFVWDYQAERRYLNDKKATIENFDQQKVTFNKIRILAQSLPTFNLIESENDTIYLLFHLKEPISSNQNFETDYFEETIIDTFSNKKHWIVQASSGGKDSTFIKSKTLVEDELSQFEKIYTLAKHVGCNRISNDKNLQLDIYYKNIKSSGFRYTSLYPNLYRNMEYETFVGEKLNEHFYWQFFDESLVYWIHPHYIVPDSEFE